MDRQLSGLLELLHNHDINYWLDSGTLLGLVRDGKLMEHDRDIDISMWETEKDNLEKVFPHLRQCGYLIHPVLYRGRVYHYKVDPVNRGKRIIDINLFCDNGEYAWCPMYYFKLKNGRDDSGRVTNHFTSKLLKVLRNILRRCWNLVRAKLPFAIETSSLPWRFFLNQAIWWIPHVYLQDTLFDEKFNAYIPLRWKDYLQFRYGNWKIPKKDWVFYQDDGGLERVPPESLIPELLKK
jgi:hypothetical protein